MAKSTQQQVIDDIMEKSIRALRGSEDFYLDELLSVYRRAQDDIVSRIASRFGREETWTLADVRRQKFDVVLNNSIDEIVANVQDESNRIVEQAMLDQYRQSHQWSAYMLDQATPAGIVPSAALIPDINVRALLNEPFQGAMFSDRIGLITDGMAQDIKDGLLQSMINGESMPDAAGRVYDVIGAEGEEAWANRSLMIARTEIMRAQNMGRDFVYGQNSDIIEDTDWLATADGRVCEWCLRRDGKTDSEIRKMPINGDPFGDSVVAPLHPHCRCTKAPRMKSWRDLGINMPEDWGDEVRGMKDDAGKWGIQPVQAFDEWKQVGYEFAKSAGGMEL